MDVTTPITDDALFAQVDAYPWTQDEEFQAGLNAILGTNSSPEQAVELTLRARCFYYTRKFNTPIDFDAYKAYRSRQSTGTAGQTTPNQPQVSQSAESTAVNGPGQTNPASGGPEQPQAPYPSSFSEIVKLITTGQPIPGIKDIPTTVLEGQETRSTKSTRRKPWEKDDSATATEDVPGSASRLGGSEAS